MTEPLPHTPRKVGPGTESVTAYLLGLNLDAQTLEMLTAALTADVCDHVEGAEA